MFRIAVPGTTANLGPGFDCLGMALGLFNTLEVSPADEFALEVTGEGSDLISQGPDNLVVRSMDRVFREYGQKRPPLRLQVHNAIPLARGLGSSAAATVAGLLAADQICGEGLSRDQLLRLAVEFEGHSDNAAPALFGGLVISWINQAGEFCHLPLGVPSGLQAVLCIPEATVSTEAARQSLPATVPLADAVFNLSRLALLLGSFWQNRWDLLQDASQDRLHQPYRLGLVPGMAEAVTTAREQGAYAAMVSGSGPTVMALSSPEAATRAGEAMVRAFGCSQVQARWVVLDLEPAGARVYTP